MNALPTPANQPRTPAIAPRRPGATYTLAATVAASPARPPGRGLLLIVLGRVLGLYYRLGPFVDLFLGSAGLRLAGSGPRSVIAIVAARSRLRVPGRGGTGASASAAPARRRVGLLWIAAVIVAASILAFLVFDALTWATAYSARAGPTWACTPRTSPPWSASPPPRCSPRAMSGRAALPHCARVPSA